MNCTCTVRDGEKEEREVLNPNTLLISYVTWGSSPNVFREYKKSELIVIKLYLLAG